MEAQVMLLRESTPAAELAARAISSVVNGEVDPITAHINISRMEAAIKLFKENPTCATSRCGSLPNTANRTSSGTAGWRRPNRA